ncbi:hypothetical protein EON65_52570 [archaeon]|nr:MAG: hypothetical protein EON65_52570 [archaeon]
MAYLLQVQQNLSVVLIDPAVESKRTWYPNYGEFTTRYGLCANFGGKPYTVYHTLYTIHHIPYITYHTFSSLQASGWKSGST